MDDFLQEERMFTFEGQQGLNNLNRICKALGYEEQMYRNGTSLEEFLRDNSGCCDAIVNWITDHMDDSDEWKVNLSYDEPSDEDDSPEESP